MNTQKLPNIKALTTDDFSKLPDTELHLLKIDIIGYYKSLYFKSKDIRKLAQKEKALQELFGIDAILDNTIEIYRDTVICKDTTEYCDENAVHSSIASFKGELI